MPRNGRRDSNQAPLVKSLRALPGVTVEPRLADCGGGVPDIIVGYQGVSYLIEIKDGEKPPSGRRLTDHEEEWHGAWTGQVAICCNLDEILAVIGWT